MKINLVLEVENPNKDVTIDMTGSSNVTLTNIEGKLPPTEVGGPDFVRPLPYKETIDTGVEEIHKLYNPPKPQEVPLVRGVSFHENPTPDGFMNLSAQSMTFDSDYLESNVGEISHGCICEKPWFPVPLWCFRDKFGNDVGLIAQDLGRYARIVHGSEIFGENQK